MIRSTDTRVIKLEQQFGFRRDWSHVDPSRLSDAELSRAIYEMTGVPAAEQTDEVLERLTTEAQTELQSRTRQ